MFFRRLVEPIPQVAPEMVANPAKAALHLVCDDEAAMGAQHRHRRIRKTRRPRLALTPHCQNIGGGHQIQMRTAAVLGDCDLIIGTAMKYALRDIVKITDH